MKEIPLTRGKVAIVDDVDYDQLVQWKWYAEKCRNGWYAARKPNTGKVYMHRSILGIHEFKIKVDHRDGDGLNNRRLNLRASSNSQNIQHQQRRTDNKSGFKGVHWHSANKKWVAQIGVFIHGVTRVVYLGSFNTKQLAAAAYNTAAVQHFGEFAVLNQL